MGRVADSPSRGLLVEGSGISGKDGSVLDRLSIRRVKPARLEGELSALLESRKSSLLGLLEDAVARWGLIGEENVPRGEPSWVLPFAISGCLKHIDEPLRLFGEIFFGLGVMGGDSSVIEASEVGELSLEMNDLGYAWELSGLEFPVWVFLFAFATIVNRGSAMRYK